MNYWIDDYLKYANNTECPTIFHKWAGISVIASIVERNPYFIININKIFANMFIALVGPPGSRKGVALRLAKPFLDEVGVNRCPESLTKEQLIEAMAGAGNRDDISKYSLVEDDDDLAHEMIDSQFSAMTLIASELATFLNMNDDKFYTILTEWFDCEDDWRHETKNKGKYHIVNVWFNILGAITPKLIANTLDATAFGSGLMSRFMFIYAEKKSKLIYMDDDSIVGGDKDFSSEREELYNSLLQRLYPIKKIKGRFLMRRETFEKYKIWRDENEEVPPFGSNSKFQHYVDRRPTQLIKLALIHACMRSDLDYNNPVIEDEDYERALAMLLEAENTMGLTFRGIGDRDLPRLIAKMVGIVANKPRGEKIAVNKIFEQFLSEVSYDEFNKMLDSVIKVGIFIPYEIKSPYQRFVAFNEEKREAFMKGRV